MSKFNHALLLRQNVFVQEEMPRHNVPHTMFHSSVTALLQEMLGVQNQIMLDNVLPCLQACSELCASRRHGGSCCCESSPEESCWSLQQNHSSSHSKNTMFCRGLNTLWQPQLSNKKHFLILQCLHHLNLGSSSYTVV